MLTRIEDQDLEETERLQAAELIVEMSPDDLEVAERLLGQMTPQATAFILNGRGSSHLLLGDAAAALHDFSRAETILRNGAQPQPTDIAEIRTLPGITYANLARATAAMAQQSSTPKHLRANYVREARDWSRRALEVLQPLATDALEGKHVKRVIDEMNAATAALLPDCRRSGSESADCR